MNAESLNRWLTLLANIGVVAGLVLLAIQIRQNTDMLRVQMSHSRSETAQSEQQAVFNSPYIPEVLSKVRSDEELTYEEMIRYESYFRAFHRNQDNILWQYNQGFLGSNIPRSVRLAVRTVVGQSRASLDLWDRTKEAYTNECMAFVDDAIVDLR